MPRVPLLVLVTAAALAGPAVAAHAQRATPYPIGERSHATVALRASPGIEGRGLSAIAFQRNGGISVDVRVAARAPGGGPVSGVLRIATCPEATVTYRVRRCPVSESRTVRLDGVNERFERFRLVERGAVQALQVTFDARGRAPRAIGARTPAALLLPAAGWRTPAGLSAALPDHPRVSVSALDVDVVGISARQVRSTVRWTVRAPQRATMRLNAGSGQRYSPVETVPLPAGEAVTGQGRRLHTVGPEPLSVHGWADPASGRGTPETLFQVFAPRTLS